MTEQAVQEQIEQILRLDKQSITPNIGGMAAYGTRFDVQREYFRGLPPEEKRTYEEAVMAICRMDDVEKAQLGLYICSELADLFAEDWRDRVADLVESLVEQGLPKAYHGAVSFAAIRLIRIFHIERLVPHVRDYLQDLINAFKEESIRRTEFKTLLHEISTTLMTVSPNDFWSEFAAFCQDRALMSSVENDFSDLTYFWASSGVRLHGLDWLRKLTTECSNIADKNTRSAAFQAIREEARYVASASGEEREVDRFLKWSEEAFGAHDDGQGWRRQSE